MLGIFSFSTGLVYSLSFSCFVASKEDLYSDVYLLRRGRLGAPLLKATDSPLLRSHVDTFSMTTKGYENKSLLSKNGTLSIRNILAVSTPTSCL